MIPTFTQTVYNATIREDVPTNSIVTDELMALDDDANEFGQITYSIVSVTAPMELTGSFVIAPSTGIIRTTGTFDREVFPGPYTIMVSIHFFFYYTCSYVVPTWRYVVEMVAFQLVTMELLYCLYTLKMPMTITLSSVQVGKQ